MRRRWLWTTRFISATWMATFYAIDLNTGEKRWKFDNPDDKTGFNTAAAVRDGLVYIGDMERQFLLSRRQDGRKKMGRQSRCRNQFRGQFSRRTMCCSARRMPRCIAWMPKRAKKRWNHQIGDQIRCSPTVIQDRCFLAGCDGKLHVIDLANGEETGRLRSRPPQAARRPRWAI